MFNTLGIYSNPLPPGTHPTQGVGPLLPVIVPVGSNNNSIGGAGNDIFNNGTITSGNGYTGSTGYTGSQGIPGPAGGFTGSAGAVGFTGSTGYTGSVGVVPVTLVTTTPFTATPVTDYMLAVDVAAPVSIVLPVSPVGTVFIVKDIDGDAALNPITITALPGGTLFDGITPALINTNYGSVTFIFNGTEWNIV